MKKVIKKVALATLLVSMAPFVFECDMQLLGDLLATLGTIV